jgi:hypothetical protein
MPGASGWFFHYFQDKTGRRHGIIMKKRAFERVPVNLESRCFDIENFGTVTDLSENGMFISSKKISFPLESQFELSVNLRTEQFHLPVRVSRITKSNGYYDGIGVELLNCTNNYLKLVNRLRLVCKSKKLSSLQLLNKK